MKLLILLVVIYLAISLGRNVWWLDRAEERLEFAKQQLRSMAAEELRLKELLAVVESDSFIEAEVRNRLHLGRSGERLIVLPEYLPIVILPEVRELDEVKSNWLLWVEAFGLMGGSKPD